MERPIFLTEEHLKTLDLLDAKGIQDLFCAVPFLLKSCPDLTPHQAQEALIFREYRFRLQEMYA